MEEFQKSAPITDTILDELSAQKKKAMDQLNARIDQDGVTNYYDRCWAQCDDKVRSEIYGLVQNAYPGDEFARALTPRSEPYHLASGMAAGYEYGRTLINARHESTTLYRKQMRFSMIALRHATEDDARLLRSRLGGYSAGVRSDNMIGSVIDDVKITDNLVFWMGFRYVQSITDGILLGNAFGEAQPTDRRARRSLRKLAKKVMKMSDHKILAEAQQES